MADSKTVHLGGETFTIRRACREDVPAVVALLADDVLGHTREQALPEVYDQAFDDISIDPNQFLAVVADEHDRLVGCLQLTLIPGLGRSGAKRMLIEAVRIAPATRGNGLGTAVLGWAHDWGRAHGARLAQLTTDKQRTDAHRFYDRLGYTASHIGYKLPL